MGNSPKSKEAQTEAVRERLRKAREGKEFKEKQWDYKYDNITDLLDAFAGTDPKLLSELFKKTIERNFDGKARATLAENLPLLAAADPKLASELYEKIFQEEGASSEKELTSEGFPGDIYVAIAAARSLKSLALVDKELFKRFYGEGLDHGKALVRQEVTETLSELAKDEPGLAQEIGNELKLLHKS